VPNREHLDRRSDSPEVQVVPRALEENPSHARQAVASCCDAERRRRRDKSEGATDLGQKEIGSALSVLPPPYVDSLHVLARPTQEYD
jgi:hypothetical protein